MPIIRFDPHAANYLHLADRGFFLYLDPAGGHLLLEDRCRHRGGPLRLGTREPGGAIRCPWHGCVLSPSVLRRRALPLVLTPAGAVAVIGSGADETAHIRFRCILANQGEDRGPCDHEARGTDTLPSLCQALVQTS